MKLPSIAQEVGVLCDNENCVDHGRPAAFFLSHTHRFNKIRFRLLTCNSCNGKQILVLGRRTTIAESRALIEEVFGVDWNQVISNCNPVEDQPSEDC